MRYINEIGAPARADDPGRLTAVGAAHGLTLQRWYGVRIAVDLAEADPAPPADPDELAALLDVEERLGATHPYRGLGQLTRLIFRRQRVDQSSSKQRFSCASRAGSAISS